MQQEIRCKRCGKPIQRVVGHKPRIYCKDASCRQLASRTNQRAKRRQSLHEQWSILPLDAQRYLETLELCYNDDAAQIAFHAIKACFQEGNYQTLLTLYRLWSREE